MSNSIDLTAPLPSAICLDSIIARKSAKGSAEAENQGPERMGMSRQQPDSPDRSGRREKEPRLPTPAQRLFLDRHGLDEGHLLDAKGAQARIAEFINDRRNLEPTEKQKDILLQAGQWQPSMTRGEATDAIGRILERSNQGTKYDSPTRGNWLRSANV